MKNPRRKFLRQSGLLAGAFFVPNIQENTISSFHSFLQKNRHRPLESITRDEAFWYQVSKAYTLTSEYLNLENGYYSLMSDEVLEAQQKNMQRVNESPSWHMRKVMEPQRKRIKNELADFAGVTAEEIAILRNTTEALNILLLGIDIPSGGEILYNVQDYFSMKEAIEMRARRSNVTARRLNLELNKMSDTEIVQAYANAISPQTKVLLVTHLINVTGQILPVRSLVEMAESKGVEVIVDAAHSFGHIPYKIPDLGCKYLGTSLHKWLGAPLGTGLMYVEKDRIEKVEPLIGCTAYKHTDIRKFEYFGTHPAHTDLTISAALRFHQALGAEVIAARLHYLKRYWTDQVAKLPGLKVQTPLEEGRSCAIANVFLEGWKVRELEKKIMDEYGIHVMAIDYQGVEGLRVTPHLYTLKHDLDRVVQAFTEIAR